MNSIVLTVKCTKTHIYYAMKNCNGDADKLKRYIVNIVDHYQVKGFTRYMYLWIVILILWPEEIYSQGTSSYEWLVAVETIFFISLTPQVIEPFAPHHYQGCTSYWIGTSSSTQ